MRGHGALGGVELERDGRPEASEEAGKDYRNIFGDAEAGERYRPFGAGPEAQAKARRMLRWVAERMRRPYSWPDGSAHNPRIPAGYTYLAQLVIHDSVNTMALFPRLGGTAGPPRNYRSARLTLDTIYDGGPELCPIAYAAGPHGWDTRIRLRLGAVPEGRGRPGGRKKVGTLRELRRARCPYLEDRETVSQAEAGSALDGHFDVLVADARNDDNVILSQITVLFHLLHNAVVDALVARGHAAGDPEQRYRQFRDARRVVTLIYRRVVFEDLLRRLLHPAVYRLYREKPLHEFSDDVSDPRMPLEISLAAARIGHAMVRDIYTINADLGPVGIKDVVRRNSIDQPKFTPLTHDWLVDWSFLFETGGGAASVNLSRKIGPALAEEFVHYDLFGVTDRDETGAPVSGGLAYRDLVRGAETGLRTVQSIIERMPAPVRALSPLVKGGRLFAGPIEAWLGAGRNPEERAFVREITRDPPLLLFLLVEAAETTHAGADPADARGKGECVGAIGSALLAEFLFRERLRTAPMIEDDAELMRLAESLFPEGVPASMPALVRAVAERMGWTDRDYQFV